MIPVRRDVAYTYLTGSETVVKGECHIIGAIVTPDGTNKTYIDIYDGSSSADPKVGRLRSAATASRPYVFGEHVILKKGIHVEFETNCESATIFWHV